jgi:zinc transport system substrate-binding protein
VAVLAVVVTGAALLLTSGVMAADERRSSSGVHGEPVTAFCSIPPQSYIIERIGGDYVSIRVMVGPGQSPHTFEPTPKQMAHLAGADVYFGIGLPFESRILRDIEGFNERLIVVDTSSGVPKRQVEGAHRRRGGHGEREEHGERDGRGEFDEHGDHGEDAGHEHDAGLPDPHVWLNPRNASAIARSTCDALMGLAPESADAFDANLATLLGDLEELDAELSETLRPLAGESVYVFHPAFGYFTDAYGLRQVPVELGGMEPSARELVELTRQAVEDGVRVIFVQPQFSSKSAAAIAAEIGGAVVPIDPLSADYLENLRALAGEIQRALADETPGAASEAQEGR